MNTAQTNRWFGVNFWMSGVASLAISMLMVWFSFAGGLGWTYLVPSSIAVLVTLLGLVASIGRDKRGAVCSGAGALICAGVILGGLVSGLHGAGFQNLILVTYFVFFPSLILAVLVWHLLAAIAVWRNVPAL
jgi:hypothetical protein